jgi:hypothetical protein
MKKSAIAILGILATFGANAQYTTYVPYNQPVTVGTVTTSTQTSIDTIYNLDQQIIELDKEIRILTDQRTQKESDLESCAKSVKGFKIAGISTLSTTGVLGGVNIYQGVRRGNLSKQIDSTISSLMTSIRTTRTITISQLRRLYENRDMLSDADISSLNSALSSYTMSVTSDSEKAEVERMMSALGIYMGVQVGTGSAPASAVVPDTAVVGTNHSSITASLIEEGVCSWNDFEALVANDNFAAVTQAQCNSNNGLTVWTSKTDNPHAIAISRLTGCEIVRAGMESALSKSCECGKTAPDSVHNGMYFNKDAQGIYYLVKDNWGKYCRNGVFTVPTSAEVNAYWTSWTSTGDKEDLIYPTLIVAEKEESKAITPQTEA